jgi:hypothetical protein
MWFEPSQFSKNKLASPANPAIYAISKYNNRKVAKIAAPFNSETSIGKLEDANLSLAHQQKILTWFAHIGEKDQGMINDTLASCIDNQEILRYFLRKANGIIVNQKPELRAINCRSCQHFNSFHKHRGGAGYCILETQMARYCRWANTQCH